MLLIFVMYAILNFIPLETKNVDKDSLSKSKLESGWSSIGLLYDVPHPLHILITASVIDR